jgi:MFS family permease
LSDRRGNRLVLRLMILGNSLTLLLTLALMALVVGLRLEGGWLPYLAIPIFLLDGAAVPARMLIGTNFLMELVPEAERPLYVGLYNTLTGITLLLSGLGGALADLFGFASVFVASLGLCIAGYVLATGLPEPRQRESQQDAEATGSG